MNAVSIGHLALRHAMSWSEIPSIAILFDDKQVIEGKATGFTNSAIENAIIHCRALLEFLGLRARAGLQLAVRPPFTHDDVGIEHFPGLAKVSIEKAVSAYPGPANEAEAALSYVIHVANKGLAHTSTLFEPHDEGERYLEIAFRGVPILMINNFYTPLGMEPPKYELESRANK
jgi:hypothetical protein